MTPTLSAAEAAERLGISLNTLYAYVSRGMIRSEAGEGRTRRYSAEDVQRLLDRRSPEATAESALHWGMPVLDSALTLVTPEGVYYRGLNAVQMARAETLERVAALLWLGHLDAPLNRAPAPVTGVQPAVQPILLHLIGLLAVQDDPAAYAQDAERVALVGDRIVRLLTAGIIGTAADHAAGAIGAAWGVDARLIDMALILCADHELNASTFAVRVAASAGATPYAAVIAGLATLSGARHGGGVQRAVALLREAGTPENAHAAVGDRLQRGDDLPGFGHRLYPNGDPRAAALLNALRQRGDTALLDAVIDAGQNAVGEAPNIDLALAGLEWTARLPRGAGTALFALGRSVGWVAHLIEQFADGTLIRPRARYSGTPPASTDEV